VNSADVQVSAVLVCHVMFGSYRLGCILMFFFQIESPFSTIGETFSSYVQLAKIIDQILVKVRM